MIPTLAQTDIGKYTNSKYEYVNSLLKGGDKNMKS